MERRIEDLLNPKQQEAWIALHDKVTRFVFFGGGAGGGKLVSNESRILTPFGWKYLKELKVGSLINNPDGSIQKIVQIKPEVTLPKWTVYFADHTSLPVAEDHLWFAWKGGKGRKINNTVIGGVDSGEVVETSELKNWISRGYNPQIPVCKEQAFNGLSRLKFNRYFLGVFLGDGCSSCGAVLITCAESDKQHYLDEFSYYNLSVGRCRIDLIGNSKIDLNARLEKWGLYNKKSWEKFIPEQFLFDSIDNRYALIQGLMDTDGYAAPHKNACYYYTVSEKLAHGMAHLLRSVGAFVTITKNPAGYKKDGKYIGCRDCYHLYIKHPEPSKLFRIKRKKEIKVKFDKVISKSIVDIKIEGLITGSCITVSGRDGLYVTDDFIVTHNSWLGAEWITSNAELYPETRWLASRNVLKYLKDTTLNTMYKVWQSHYITHDHYNVNSQSGVIRWHNGSEILLRELKYNPSDPLFQDLGSLELTGAFVDEAPEITFKAFDVLKTRVGRQYNDKYGIMPKILLTGNPVRNWVYNTFIKSPPSKEYRFIPALANDNTKFLDAVYYDALNSITDHVTRQRLIFGNWDYDDDPGLLCNGEKIIEAFSNIHVQDGELLITCDVARKGKDKSVIVVWSGWKAIEVIMIPVCLITELADRINQTRSKYGIGIKAIIVDEDGVGGGLVDILGCYGFVNNSKPIEQQQGVVVENFDNLRSQCIYKLCLKVNQNEVYLQTKEQDVFDRVSEELAVVKRTDITNDKKVTIMGRDEFVKQLGRSPDYLSALMMRVWFDLVKRNYKGAKFTIYQQ